jgi:hypothetical protein
MVIERPREPVCGFCSRAETDAGPLAGAGVYICGTCARTALEVLSGRSSEETGAGWSFGRDAKALIDAMSPREAFNEVERARAAMSGLREFLEEAATAAVARACPHSDLVLPDGSIVRGVRFDRSYTREVPPAVGVYLDRVWSPPWPHFHVDWPDFGVTADPPVFRAALVSLLARAREGERVEIGCLGGHGRTGTALACLAVLAGVPASEAVAWVRQRYCSRAVETPDQQAFVEAFG